jgi:lipopolysaccharide/colanic/teichoic acid biosynthesis glycosyltransferase
VLEEQAVEHVVLAFSTAPHEVLIRIAAQCHERGIELSIVPRLFEKVTTWHTVDHIGGLPLMTVRPANPKSWQFDVKYALDRLIAATLLVLAAPVMLLTALAVRIRMGRPVLFRQERVGRDGRKFEIVKFRSMERVDGLDCVTPFGAFLRRYSLDELPQLLNVVKGEMSLIGPRPERPELVSKFELEIYRYADRHRTKSGITGWAQVHGIGRGEERFSPDTLARRVEWDNYYIENWSLWLDVKILLFTAMAVFRFMQRSDGTVPTTTSS